MQVVGYLVSNDIFWYHHITIDTTSKVFELFPNTLIRLLYCSAKTDEESKQSGKRVIQYTIALINAISSIKAGRDYLLPKDSNLAHGDHMTKLLIKRLVQILNKETEDSLIRQYSVGVLQKFSLRNTAQVLLVENDIIERIVNIIRAEYQTLTDYSLEWSMAMLMNLSLRTTGKQRMQEIYQIIIPLLKGILLSSSGQIIIYWIGILFSIISNKVMRDFIKQTNLKDYLNKTREKLRNNLFTSIEADEENEDEDISEDEKRQLLVQITYIIQKLDEKDDPDRIQEAEESRIGFTNSEEQESIPEEDNNKDLSRPGTAQRGLQDEDNGDITDDEDLDTTLRDSGVLFGNSLLIAEYSLPDVKDGTPRRTQASAKIEEIKGKAKEETISSSTPPRMKENIVFDYKRPSHKHERISDLADQKSDMQIRSSQQLIMKNRLELESHHFNKEAGVDMLANRYSRHYQSVNHPIQEGNENDYNLVFKSRSKLIRTPQTHEENPKDQYEQETFGNKNSRPSIPDKYEEIRTSEVSKSKPKMSVQEFFTEIKRAPKDRIDEKSAKKLSTSLKF